MKLFKAEQKFVDERGEIIDVLVRETVEYVTIIKCRKGAVRGNHWHKDTFQWVHVLEGSFRVYWRMPGEPVRAQVIHRDDVVLNECLEHHCLEALEDSVMLVMTRGPRGGDDYERDTYRLETSLVDEYGRGS